MKFNIRLKDLTRLNDIFETSQDVDAPLIMETKDKKHIYVMNERTYLNLSTKGDAIRNKEIKNQAGKSRRK